MCSSLILRFCGNICLSYQTAGDQPACGYFCQTYLALRRAAAFVKGPMRH